MSELPGGQLSNRIMHFFWICDCSGSMSLNGKIESLNSAIRESIPHMQEAADANPYAQVMVRVIKFSNGAAWHIPTATRVQDFRWVDLTADGVTDMGKAMLLLSEQMKMPPMPRKGLPPVMVLVSDGQPTDDFGIGLSSLMAQPWAKRSVRIAIGIGEDADTETLKKFIGNNEIEPLTVRNPEDLVRYIKWVSTAVVQAVSAPSSRRPNEEDGGQNIQIPALPPTIAVGDMGGDVW
ncbi:vWA domain-containing protein [Herpetosiphon giganteus]|uniref:vWA domain-containing protein n=1 Tax=Herpetosiphon giganteus TaxID=2029754 RepID=UPI00195AC73A|nr:VWA domain-containing protein [Herpetosiphon giganteus]MBM7846529.1 uncharacterized protein YegL [Herpetosiphon giganteus]